ncbi:MAG: HAD family hydrolase [Spirochaetaceae bacterium]|jgi:putative hydrolase of the HAD superfamily|nr:HAD family hydrolase [Spirochaetaceae bacterium]
MSRKFDGVAFDLDGTLYPNYRFYLPLIPFIVKEHRLLFALGKARTILRGGPFQSGDSDTFYDKQARIMGTLLRADPGWVKQKTEDLIYRGWEPLFKRIRLYPELRETLEAIRGAGLKLGLLSDFPPETKLENLGLGGYWDAVLCSEQIGALKPAPAPFRALTARLGIPEDRLLYVGNSVKYDIMGAKNAGIWAALIAPWFRKGRVGNADFIFSRYSALREYIKV